jgi:hypothetical protein
MKTNIREFTRNFATYREAAAKGEPIEVRDREGVSYLFKLKTPAPANLAVAVAHLAGTGTTGVKKKSLTGYGRAR